MEQHLPLISQVLPVTMRTQRPIFEEIIFLAGIFLGAIVLAGFVNIT